jgi:hypothetical protein
MNSPLTSSDTEAAGGRGLARLLVNLLVALVVIAVGAATFVFSYDGVHALALLGGVSKQFARYYPGLFDAVLVIACVAAVVLRDGRWWARLWAWLVLIVVLAAIGTTDVLHAMNYTLRHRVTEGVVAAAPAAAVLLAFSLLLTMLRHPKGRPGSAGRRGAQEEHEPTQPLPVPFDLPALPAGSVSGAEPPTVEAPAVTAGPVPAGTRVLPAPAAIALPAGTPRATPGDEEDREAPAPPTRPVPAHNGFPPVPSGTEPAKATAEPAKDRPATEPNEVIAPAPAIQTAAEAAEAAPPQPESATAESPEPTPAEEESQAAEPAPPTAASPAPASPAAEEPATETPSTRSGIRYAGGKSTRASKPKPAVPSDSPRAEGSGRPEVSGASTATDYWDTEEAGQYAGLVYPAREENTGAEQGAAGEEDAGTSPARHQSPEPDDDAPPYATAPFAKVPRLNRVRSTPAPPADEEED